VCSNEYFGGKEEEIEEEKKNFLDLFYFRNSSDDLLSKYS
jgi:hypothetical protein